MSDHDFNIQIKVRNGRLLRRMRQCGFTSAVALAEAAGIDKTSVYRFVNLGWSPLLSSGDLRPSAMAICEALNSIPDDLWPKEIQIYQIDRNTAEVEVSLEDVAKLPGVGHTVTLGADGERVWKELFSCLNPREAKVIEGRYQYDMTLKDLADEMDVTPARVREIQKKALSKMRRRSLTQLKAHWLPQLVDVDT